MADHGSGSYFLLFLSLFNLAALTCVIVYNVNYTNKDLNQDDFRENLFQDIKDDVTELFSGRSKRDIEQNQQINSLIELDSLLQNEKTKLLEECRSVAKEEVIKVLKEALSYIQPLESEAKHKRQTNTAGNELASIFGEIAKTEVDILTQYCGNNSHICLPGEKGDRGDAGLIGLKGEPGSAGIAGIKGERGDAGADGIKGEPGLSGPQGPQGIKGDMGSKGDPGLYGVPGSKGQRGVMGPQGYKGAQGDPGLDGSKGDIGVAGPQGPQGIKGDMGAKGDQGLDGTSGVKGERGAMGPQGLKGDLGQVGVKGDKGDTGLDGQIGARGLQGPKGEKGDSADVPIPTFINPSTPCCSALSVPEFTEQLQEIRVTEGSNVTLNCNPRGYPVPAVTWVPDPNGQVFPAGRTYMTPGKLTLTSVSTADSSTITCQATNALGTAQKSYLVTVYQHLKFDKVPQNYTVMTGNPVTLECQIEGPLNPQISWYKVMPDGSKSLVTNGIVTTTNNVSQLHFDHVVSSVEGQYMCEGHNGVENVQMTAFLKTYGPPHIRPQGQITLLNGQKARLTCVADAEPPATITWTYPPGVTNAYVDNDGSLVILNANERDSRYFICTATNKYGTDQEQITVNVKFPPEVSVSPSQIAVDPGKTSIALQCSPKGDSPLTVEWYKDGIPVSGNSHVFVLPGNVLLVNQANTADLGVYTCRATNNLGTASATSYAYINAGNVQCSTSFSSCTQSVCSASCPPSCSTDPTPAVQIGAVHYTQSSSICKAALMSGVISQSGGNVMWRNVGFQAELLGVNTTPSP